MVFGADQANAFSDEHVELMTAIGTQSTLALQNAVLYQNLLGEKERIVEVEEDARKKLSRDLHDGPTQTVAAMRHACQLHPPPGAAAAAASPWRNCVARRRPGAAHDQDPPHALHAAPARARKPGPAGRAGAACREDARHLRHHCACWSRSAPDVESGCSTRTRRACCSYIVEGSGQQRAQARQVKSAAGCASSRRMGW